MFDQLLQLAQQNISQALEGNQDVPADQKNNIAGIAGESIVNTLMNQVSGGDLGGIMEMLSGKNTESNHPIVQSLSGGLVNNLVEKSGISSGAAQNIATLIVPIVMNMLNGKVSESQNGGTDISSILSNLTGGGNANSNPADMIGGLLNNFLGGNNANASNNPASSITNLLGNLFNK